MALITLAQAKAHLRVTTDYEDSDIWLKAQQANEFIIHHLKDQADDTWDADTVPFQIQAAILCVLEDLYLRRPINDDLLNRLTIPWRDPTLA